MWIPTTRTLRIDFETLPDGSELPGGWWCQKEWLDEYGLTLSSSGGYLDMPRVLNTWDVANVDYATVEQGSPNSKCSGPGVGEGGEPGMDGENCVPQGNVLMVMPNMDANDSSSSTVSITFDFLHSIHLVREIGLMNIHGNATRVSVVHDSEMGIQTTNLHVVGLGKNSVQTRKINLNDVSQITVHFEHVDGAITFLSFRRSVDESCCCRVSKQSRPFQVCFLVGVRVTCPRSNLRHLLAKNGESHKLT